MLVVTRSLTPAAAGAFFTATALCLMLAGVVRLDIGNGLVHALARNRSVDGAGRDGGGGSSAGSWRRWPRSRP
ncbi:hypothetical protein GCM10027612_82560 [Microbispora bryophytorum subsp. camponoti]